MTSGKTATLQVFVDNNEEANQSIDGYFMTDIAANHAYIGGRR
jgi:hypothetical protein